MDSNQNKKQLLKIAYLSDSEIPSKRANTVHVMKMCAALSSQGVDVTLFCNQKGEYTETELFDHYHVMTPFEIKAVKPCFSGKLQLIEYAIRKAWLVRKGHYDFCYGRSLLALFLLRNHKPFIYESHILPNRGLFIRLERILLKNRNCRGLVVISNSLKDEYLKLFPFLKEDNITVLHDGADVFDGTIQETEVPSELVEAHKQGPTVGYIGHLYPGKCMEVMMQIASKMSDTIFHVIGGTDDWVNHWKEECRKEGLPNIHFYGFIENSKVASCYHYLDVVILPFSDNIYYNKDKKDNIGKYISPLKLFEAMACSKAIVASKLVSIQEVINDGNDGILVSPDDIEGWKKQIEALLMDTNRRNELGLQAKCKLEESYSWRKRAERIINIIKRHK